MDRYRVKSLKHLAGFWALPPKAVAVIVNLLFLLPLMNTPFLGDDSWCESTIRGFTDLANISLGQLCWAVEKDYIKGGRWYPLVTYYYPLFYFAGREVYKALIIGLILVNVLQFGALVRSITRSQSMAIMAMLIPPLFFQLRLYHDPILSYYGLMQVETAFVFGSLSCFLTYLRNEKPAWLAGSVTLYGLNLLTYEAFYGVIIAHAILAYHEWGKAGFARMCKTLMPFAALAFANLLVMMFVRSLFTVRYEGNRLNLDVMTWGVTIAKQAFGALPLSYFTASHGTVDPISTALRFNELIFLTVASVLLFFGARHWFKANDRANSASKGLAALALLGIAIWITPCLIVSGAEKYQQELRWGLAYLPVYLSYFGVMMLALAGIELLRKTMPPHLRLRKVVSLVYAALVVCVFALNYSANLYVVNAYRNAELRPRLLVEEALKNGLFRSIPEGAYLICDAPVRPWDTPAFYKMHSGITLQVVRAEAFERDEQLGTRPIETAFNWLSDGEHSILIDLEGKMPLRPVFAGYSPRFDGRQGPILDFKKTAMVTSASPDVFMLTYSSREQGPGLVVLGKIKKLKAKGDRVLAVAADKLSLFVEFQARPFTNNINLRVRLIDLHTLAPGPWRVVEARDVIRISKNPLAVMWVLELNQSGYGIDPRSVTVVDP